MNLKVKNISLFSLRGINLSVGKGEKIAILGPNGSGKSTLLKIIAGLIQPDYGTVEITDCWAGCSYVYQDPTFSVQSPYELAMELPNPNSLQKWMAKLGFIYDDDWLEKPFCEMSGGQRKAVQLSFALAQTPDILLLDEPENHLDIVSRQKLIEVMENFKGILLFVSHDRTIINHISSSIAMIEDGELETFSDMNVEDILIEKATKLAASQRRWITEDKALKQLRRAVEILKLKAKFNTKGAGVYRSRKRELEKRKASQVENRPDLNERRPKFRLNDPEWKKGKMIFEMKDVSFSYESLILKKVTAEVRFGDRIAILGRNGSGKTTLLRLLQDLPPTEGISRIGASIKFGWFGQLSNFDNRKSALTLIEESGVLSSASAAFAARILLNYDEARGVISNLSGGQLSRLRVAIMLNQNPDCVILDEPTNNLDQESWEELVQLFEEYRGTLIVVSHDESFLDRLDLQRFWVIKNTKLTEYLDFSKALENI